MSEPEPDSLKSGMTVRRQSDRTWMLFGDRGQFKSPDSVDIPSEVREWTQCRGQPVDRVAITPIYTIDPGQISSIDGDSCVVLNTLFQRYSKWWDVPLISQLLSLAVATLPKISSAMFSPESESGHLRPNDAWDADHDAFNRMQVFGSLVNLAASAFIPAEDKGSLAYSPNEIRQEIFDCLSQCPCSYIFTTVFGTSPDGRLSIRTHLSSVSLADLSLEPNEMFLKGLVNESTALSTSHLEFSPLMDLICNHTVWWENVHLITFVELVARRIESTRLPSPFQSIVDLSVIPIRLRQFVVKLIYFSSFPESESDNKNAQIEAPTRLVRLRRLQALHQTRSPPVWRQVPVLVRLVDAILQSNQPCRIMRPWLAAHLNHARSRAEYQANKRSCIDHLLELNPPFVFSKMVQNFALKFDPSIIQRVMESSRIPLFGPISTSSKSSIIYRIGGQNMKGFIVMASKNTQRLSYNECTFLASRYRSGLMNVDLPMPLRLLMATLWTKLPTTKVKDVITVVDDSNRTRVPVGIQECLLRGLVRQDEIGPILRYFLQPSLISSDRSRCFSSVLQKSATLLSLESFQTIIRSILCGKRSQSVKISFQKGVVRMIARYPFNRGFVKLIELVWKRKTVHRDVRIVIIQSALRWISLASEIGHATTTAWNILRSIPDLSIESPSDAEVLMAVLGTGFEKPQDVPEIQIRSNPEKLAGCPQPVVRAAALSLVKQMAVFSIPTRYHDQFVSSVLLKLTQIRVPHVTVDERIQQQNATKKFTTSKDDTVQALRDVSALARAFIPAWTSEETASDIVSSLVGYIKDMSQKALIDVREDVQKANCIGWILAVADLMKISQALVHTELVVVRTFSEILDHLPTLRQSSGESLTLDRLRYDRCKALVLIGIQSHFRPLQHLIPCFGTDDVVDAGLLTEVCLEYMEKVGERWSALDQSATVDRAQRMLRLHTTYFSTIPWKQEWPVIDLVDSVLSQPGPISSSLLYQTQWALFWGPKVSFYRLFERYVRLWARSKLSFSSSATDLMLYPGQVLLKEQNRLSLAADKVLSMFSAGLQSDEAALWLDVLSFLPGTSYNLLLDSCSTKDTLDHYGRFISSIPTNQTVLLSKLLFVGISCNRAQVDTGFIRSLINPYLPDVDADMSDFLIDDPNVQIFSSVLLKANTLSAILRLCPNQIPNLTTFVINCLHQSKESEPYFNVLSVLLTHESENIGSSTEDMIMASLTPGELEKFVLHAYSLTSSRLSKFTAAVTSMVKSDIERSEGWASIFSMSVISSLPTEDRIKLLKEIGTKALAGSVQFQQYLYELLKAIPTLSLDLGPQLYCKVLFLLTAASQLPRAPNPASPSPTFAYDVFRSWIDGKVDNKSTSLRMSMVTDMLTMLNRDISSGGSTGTEDSKKRLIRSILLHAGVGPILVKLDPAFLAATFENAISEFTAKNILSLIKELAKESKNLHRLDLISNPSLRAVSRVIVHLETSSESRIAEVCRDVVLEILADDVELFVTCYHERIGTLVARLFSEKSKQDILQLASTIQRICSGFDRVARLDINRTFSYSRRSMASKLLVMSILEHRPERYDDVISTSIELSLPSTSRSSIAGQLAQLEVSDNSMMTEETDDLLEFLAWDALSLKLAFILIGHHDDDLVYSLFLRVIRREQEFFAVYDINVMTEIVSSIHELEHSAFCGRFAQEPAPAHTAHRIALQAGYASSILRLSDSVAAARALETFVTVKNSAVDMYSQLMHS